MKTISALVIAGFGLSAHASILTGPVVNPANGHVYYLLSQNTWNNAEAEAVAVGGHLTTIRNAAEDRWVYSTFGAYGGALWIGLTDREKVFAFTWASGEPLSYTNWGGGQPDNGTGGVEFYAHMWPAGSRSPAPGKWNDYGNADDVLGFPLYGVAEISPASVVQVSLPASLTPSNAQEVANSVTTTTSGPELHVFTAVELCWASEANKAYQVQWTASLEHPQWVNVSPIALGTGTNLSVFDSARAHQQGFYRVQIVKRKI